ncbi:MAG: hypothetical protein ACTSWW_06515 [Promethearchaeota archaeon]
MQSQVKFILKSFIQMAVYWFVAMIFIFFISRSLPGNPYMIMFGSGGFELEAYELEVQRLGLDRPLITQLFLFLRNALTGNWGESIRVSEGALVSDLVATRFSKSLELSIISLSIAIPIGIFVGNRVGKSPNSVGDKIIRIWCFVALAAVVFWTGSLAQYFSYKLSIPLPLTLYHTPYIELSKDITGLRLLDSILLWEWNVWLDTVKHLILPVAQLVPPLTSITILQMRSFQLKRSKLKQINSYPDTEGDPKMWMITLCVVILSFLLLSVEPVFHLQGFMSLFIKALRSFDSNLVVFCFYRYLMIFICVNFIANLIHGLTLPNTLEKPEDDPNSVEAIEPTVESSMKTEFTEKDSVSFGAQIKEWINPIPFLIGCGMLVVLILTAILVPLFTDDYLIVGQDVFERFLWGSRTALVIGFTTILFGGVVGIPIGFFAGISGKSIDQKIMAITNALLYLPLLWVPFLIMFYSKVLIFGVLGIPFIIWITRNITAQIKTEIESQTKKSPNVSIEQINYKKLMVPVGVKLAGQLSLFFGATVILYEIFSFLGFKDADVIDWGRDLNYARELMLMNPWAVIWPGVGIFLLCFSVFLLQLGFRDEKRK